MKPRMCYDPKHSRRRLRRRSPFDAFVGIVSVLHAPSVASFTFSTPCCSSSCTTIGALHKAPVAYHSATASDRSSRSIAFGTRSEFISDVISFLDEENVEWSNMETEDDNYANKLIMIHHGKSSDAGFVLHLIPSPQSLSDVLPPDYTRKMSLEFCTRTTSCSSILHLHEDIWLLKNNIVRKRILAKAGNIKTRIYARKTVCRRIDKPTAYNFLETNHLWGAVKAKFNYGLFRAEKDPDTGEVVRETLVAVAAFGPRRRVLRGGSSEQTFSHELIRFCTLVDGQVVGGISKISKCFIQNHKPDDVVTVIDRDWGEAHGWKKLHFVSVQTMPSLVMAVGKQDGVRRHLVGSGIEPTEDASTLDNAKRPGLPVKVLDELNKIEQDDWKGALQCMSSLGYHAVYDVGVLRFIMFTSDISEEEVVSKYQHSIPQYAQSYYSDNSGIQALLNHAEEACCC